MGKKQGAGIIPFALWDNRLHFLLHKTFSGRRTGLFVDFGGGSLAGETQFQTAAREFVEETEAMFLSDSPEQANLDQHGEAQTQIAENILHHTQEKHPDWWCRRVQAKNKKPKDWKTFFIELEYKPLDSMNRLWETNPQANFKKRRALFWLTSDQLLDAMLNHPEKLWTRVRELDGAVEVIRSIQQHYRSSCSGNRQVTDPDPND